MLPINSQLYRQKSTGSENRNGAINLYQELIIVVNSCLYNNIFYPYSDSGVLLGKS